MMVRVLNCSGTEHRDRYAGVDYVFGSDPVEIPLDAAVHIFGMGLKDRTRQLVRLGWAPTSRELPAAIARLDSFIFEPIAVEEEYEERAVVVPSFVKPTGVPPPDAGIPIVKDRTRSVLMKAS